MSSPFYRSFLLLSIYGLSLISLSAQFTYVDATLENSTLNGATFTLSSPANYTFNDSSGSDGLWSLRTSPSTFEGGTHFESDPGRPPLNGGENDFETLPDIITTLTLPTAGTYRIVVVFQSNSNRDIAARIGSSPSATDTFSNANSLNLDQDIASPDIIFDSSYTNGRTDNAGGADLGTVTTTIDNETIQIFINGFAVTDDLDANGRHDDERTRYDGLAYQLLPPTTGPTHRDIFIIAGQSNADGRGLNNDLTGNLAPFAAPQPNSIIYFSNPAYEENTTPPSDALNDPLYRTWSTLRPGFSIAPPAANGGALPRDTFGVEVSAATVLSQTFPNPAFIKVTRGGTALVRPSEDWYPPSAGTPSEVGPLYTELLSSVENALQDLTDAGDTYTLHAAYWHQGEADTNRSSSYSQLLQTFVSDLRRDLNKPNLRFIVGELAPQRDVLGNFRAAQWDASRAIRNGSFLSSTNLLTSDGTHFDSPSMIEFGLRLGELFLGQGPLIDFEEPAYSTAELDRQNDFESELGITITTTSNSGEYSAGQALTDSLGTTPLTAFRENVLPLAQAQALQAEFFPTQPNSSLLVAGWQTDTNHNNLFDPSETSLGLGLGNDGLFHLRVGSTLTTSGGFPYQSNTWYRLTASWDTPDSSNLTQISLFARDLTNGIDLNGGAAIASITAPLNPSTWLGTGLQLANGMIDSIGVEPPGFQGWLANRFPTLSTEPNVDSDGDSLPNSFEYALGLDPTLSDCPSINSFLSFSNTQVTFSIPEIPRAEDTLIELESSDDLSTWTSAEAEQTDASRDFAFPANEQRRFFRQFLEICD